MWKFFCTFAATNEFSMEKRKTIRTYQRRTKSGKAVTVRQHTAKYDAADELKKSLQVGAGEELSARAANHELGFSLDEYKSWYHWDAENDPENATAKKVEEILKRRMSPKKYREYYDRMTEEYSARGHKKAFESIGDFLPKGGILISEVRKQVGTVKKISEQTLHHTLESLYLRGTIGNLKGVPAQRRGEILDELTRRGWLVPDRIEVTMQGKEYLLKKRGIIN